MAFQNDNTRVFYATQAVAIGKIGATGVADSAANGNSLAGEMAICHGVQSIGVDTNFNLEQAFELGQLSLYENIEDIPDISVTMQKFLDGYSLLYHLGASYDSAGTKKTNFKLTGRTDTRADVRMVINDLDNDYVDSGNSAASELYCSGMYISSVSYTVPTDGTCTEDVTFVGNNKRWLNAADTGQVLLVNSSASVDGAFLNVFNNDAPVYSGVGSSDGGNVLRRDDVVVSGSFAGGGGATKTYTTILPDIIGGVGTDDVITGTVWATNGPTNAGRLNTAASGGAHIQSFTCSVDFGREAINQLGSRTPYSRYATFPTEVTSTLEVIATEGDNVTAVETNRTNLSNHEICIALKDSTVIHLGKKNKVSSVTYGGGDAGGGNASITYNFSNFNDFVIFHSGDPLSSETDYWTYQF